MDLKRIKDLIDLFADTDLGELNFSEDGCQLRLVRNAATPAAHGEHTVEPPALPPVHAEAAGPVAAEAAVSSTDVVAPLHGVLHLAPTPDEPPYVNVGDPVQVGQVLGMLEAMKMFHTLKSDVEGIVAAVLVVSGSEVESGQPLFRIT